jgi:hypothetical protein
MILAVAAPVDEQKARQLASDFLNNMSPHGTRSANSELTRAVTGVADGNDAAIYVFNSENSFVIISADDRTPAVLGYSDHGIYDMNKAPEGLKAMLGWLQASVRNYSTTRGEVSIHDAIKPLLTTKWNQHAPYNLLCPYDEVNDAPSVTGCIATAMAQIMKYHEYPSAYNWSLMKDEYDSGDESEAANEVAKVMKDAGESVYMEYSANGSFAKSNCISEALRNTFGYALSTELVSRSYFSAQEWDELIYTNLKNKMPVLYSGRAIDIDDSKGYLQGVEGGHSFIVDGYDGKGLYHVNWGWGGLSDGFFLLSLLNPENQGAGGTSGSEGYSIEALAVVGIRPAETPVTVHRLQSNSFSVDGQTTLTRSTASEDFPSFKIKVLYGNFITGSEDRKYDVGLVFCKDDEVLSILPVDSKDFPKAMGYYINDELQFGKGLSNGTYQIRAVCRESGKEDWYLCQLATSCYIEAVIKDLSLTLLVHGIINDGVAKFTANSKEISSDPCERRPITFKLNLTDLNKESNSPIYLWGNEDPENTVLLAGIGSNLDPGETGDVEIHYTPQRSGDFKFYISGSDEDYTESLVATYEVNVAARVPYDLVVDVALEVEGADSENKVTGTALEGVVKIKNNSSEAYQDPVRIWLYKEDPSTGQFVSVTRLVRSAEIPVGETAEVPFELYDLKTDVRYALLVEMYENTDWKYVNLDNGFIPKSIIFMLVDATGIQSIQSSTPDAEVYNLNGVFMGKASDLKSLPKGLYIINKKKVVNN